MHSLTQHRSVTSEFAWDNSSSVLSFSAFSTPSPFTPVLPSVTDSVPPQASAVDGSDFTPMCPTGGKIGNFTLDVSTSYTSHPPVIPIANLNSLMIPRPAHSSTLLAISGSLKGSSSRPHRLKPLNPTALRPAASLWNLCHHPCLYQRILVWETLLRLVLAQMLRTTASDLTSKARVLAARQKVPKVGVTLKFQHTATTTCRKERNQ